MEHKRVVWNVLPSMVRDLKHEKTFPYIIPVLNAIVKFTTVQSFFMLILSQSSNITLWIYTFPMCFLPQRFFNTFPSLFYPPNSAELNCHFLLFYTLVFQWHVHNWRLYAELDIKKVSFLWADTLLELLGWIKKVTVWRWYSIQLN